MRALIWTCLSIAALSASAPVRAQTYDPAYPVCMQVYGSDGSFIECRYNTMEECRESATGRAATCMINPFRRDSQPASVPQPPR
jgi:hypothetical protein